MKTIVENLSIQRCQKIITPKIIYFLRSKLIHILAKNINQLFIFSTNKEQCYNCCG